MLFLLKIVLSIVLTVVAILTVPIGMIVAAIADIWDTAKLYHKTMNEIWDSHDEPKEVSNETEAL